MAAAFLLEKGSKKPSMMFSREVEENGIKFNVENATEDIINGLFCTYEPPTSKMEQYKAAKAVRKNPDKFATRPSVPKSILKWKFKKFKKKKEPPATPNTTRTTTTTTTTETRDEVDGSGIVVAHEKKNVTWRDERSKEDRTEIENTVVGLTSKYCGGTCNQGEGIAEIMSSPTGRAAQKFFEGASSVFGTKTADANSGNELLSRDNDQQDGEKKVFYDDLGNPIREDDMSTSSSSFYRSTEKPAIEADPTSTEPSVPLFRSNINDPKNGGHRNLFCSNIPFMDTVIEGIGIAGVAAASAAAAAGVPENLCSPYKMKKPDSTTTNNGQIVTVSKKTEEQAQISEELRQAQESLGIYEPESYDDQPSETSGSFKLKHRQSTPKHVPGSEKLDEEEDKSHRDPPESTRSEKNNMSSQRSYATSDITMGNTTIHHFSGNASLFDETLEKEDKFPLKNKHGTYSALVEELKNVQRAKGLEGSTQQKSFKSSSVSSPKSNVKSLWEGYEKSAKSPKSKLVTNSYINSLKSPSNRFKMDASPRVGTVASLSRQFESPRSNGQRSFVRPTTPTSAHRSIDPTVSRNSFVRKSIDPDVRKSIDPAESRNHDGTVHLLPPTPRRKQQTTDEPSSINDRVEAFGGELPPTPRRRSPSPHTTGYSMVNDKLQTYNWDNNSNNDAKETKTPTEVSVNTDAEIREEASSILDAPRWKSRPSFKGRRPRALVDGPETVEDENEDAVDAPKKTQKDNEAPKTSDANGETKRDKKKKRRQKFASKFKKSMEKALEPVVTATRKVESQRIAK